MAIVKWDPFWKYVVIALLIPGLMITVSCSKKSVKTDSTVPSISGEAGDKDAKRLRDEALEAQKRAGLSPSELAKHRFLNDDVYFDFDSATLTAQAQDVLNQKHQWLLSNSAGQVTIEGHCDERGSNAYNLALGDRRAQSAKSFLAQSGIPESRLSTVSFGEEKPVDPGHTEAAWAKNRRAHFVLK
ncbi:MAG: peptidoglycan-associated lipoprotein Pal [Pseudomonadota bacterium]